jgi:hypothetical protein
MIRSIVSILWICVALFLVLRLDLVTIIMQGDDRVDFRCLIVGQLFLWIFLAIFLYLTLYVRYVKGVPINYQRWRINYPRMIPFATVAGLSSIPFHCCGVWRIYGLYTVPIFGVISLGLLHLLALVG